MHTAPLYPKRASRTTSCTEGASPFQPATGRQSSKDAVNARVVEQARTALHQVAFTLFCKMVEQDSALAFAKAAKNFAVLHPGSTVRTTKRSRPPSPDKSGSLSSTCLNQDRSVGQLLELWQTHRDTVHRTTTSVRHRSPPNGAHADCGGQNLAQGHV